LLAHGQWFSPGTPASSTTKTGHHDIAEILLKVELNTKNQIKSSSVNKIFDLNRVFHFAFHMSAVIDWFYCQFQVCENNLTL
jgi:hypothetical protein